jgi:hypothetical protein
MLFGCMTWTVASCNRADDDKQTLLSNVISAKWDITDPAGKFASFEFNNDGNYIVIEHAGEEETESYATIRNSDGRDFQRSLFQKYFTQKTTLRALPKSDLSPIHFGTYKIEENRIILSGFGVMDVISFTADEFTFSFTLEATGEKGEYVARKAENTIASSNRTDLFCRTWTVVNVTVDENAVLEYDKTYYIQEYGDNWKAAVEKERTEELAGLIVLFSKAGTYLVLYAGEKEHEAGLSEWKWANEEETTFYYSWNNWTDDDWTNQLVRVIELNNSTLNIREREFTFHLIPAK